MYKKHHEKFESFININMQVTKSPKIAAKKQNIRTFRTFNVSPHFKLIFSLFNHFLSSS